MKRFILVTFLFLAWGFYELSGGSSFEPEVVASAEAAASTAPVATEEIVTRGVDPTLASLAIPERLTQPLIVAPEAAPEPVADILAEPQTEPQTGATVDAVVEEVAARDTDATVDLRATTTRANMRTGPGTDYDRVDTLDVGTVSEVVETDPSGWVKIRVVDTGLEGWMAARLLASVEG